MPPDTSSGRRAQPVRQTRANPPRAHSGLGRSFGARDASGRISPDEEEQTEIYPAITHFADAITALPRELVRHFTLLKEVDAKIFAPEEALVQLVETALNHPLPARSQSTDRLQITDSTPTPGSGPMSVNGSIANARNTSIPDDADNPDRATAVYDADNLPRRQLFRQCAYTMQEMLVSLDEKNHVISTATEALDKHLARLNDCLPFVENEISEEARHGNTKHWAYTENRVVTKPNERSRRENANVNHLTNAAAAAAAEEAAARSDARKQAMLAKKGRAQLPESDFDDNTDHRRDNKRPHGNTKKGRPVETSNSGGTTNGAAAHGNPPSKRRKVEKGPTGGAVMERSLSSVYGSNGVAAKGKANSPRGTPLPDTKKRSKAAATTNGQPRKRYVTKWNAINLHTNIDRLGMLRQTPMSYHPDLHRLLSATPCKKSRTTETPPRLPMADPLRCERDRTPYKMSWTPLARAHPHPHQSSLTASITCQTLQTQRASPGAPSPKSNRP